MILQISPKIQKHWIVFINTILISIYCIGTLPALLDPNHQLKNLEPYPDGLLYSLSARNLSLGRGLQLLYNNSHITPWVPMAYPLSLSIGYFFSKDPASFYLINVCMGAISIIGIVLLTHTLTGRKWASALAGALYLSHAYIWWIPTLPMTENLILPLTLMIWFVIALKKKWSIPVVSFIAILLLWTRLALAGVVIALFALQIGINLYSTKHHSQKKNLALQLLLFLLIAFGIMLSTPIGSTIKTFIFSLFSYSPYYGIRFIAENFSSYSRVILGFSEKFLWRNDPMCNPILCIASFFGFFHQLKKHQPSIKYALLPIALCWISLFPILLIFYSFDARYIILTIPVSILGWILFLQHPLLQKKRTLAFFLLITFLVQTISQHKFFKELVASNFYGRSTGWQYQSILQLNHFAQSHNGATIITALPPVLVDAYQIGSYSVLPLSMDQEFLKKKRVALGGEFTNENIEATFYGSAAIW